MKKLLIVLGIFLVAVLLVGCAKKAEFAKPAANEPAAAEATPIDNDIAGLDSELDVDSVDTDLGALDQDLDSL